MLCASDAHGLRDNSVMSEIHVEIRPRSAGWADLPALNEAQEAVRQAGAASSLVVRGAPGSGRTTTALALIEHAMNAGQSALLLVPDRVRADELTPRVQALAANTVRPVRTPASFAYYIVNQWRVMRPDPLGPVELVTGALQDELIGELLDTVEVSWPQSIPEQMREMPAFRAEIRDLFSRAGEAGIDGVALEAAGEEFSMPQWVGAGQLLSAYLDGPQFSVEYRDLLKVDLSRIQSLAAQLIDSWEERAPARGVYGTPPVPSLVVVDDLHDCTPSTLRLLEALHRAGARIAAFSDPDVAIAGYRGGEPHLDLRLAQALNVSLFELGEVYTQGERLRECVRCIASGITQSGPVARRNAPSAPGTSAGQVIAHLGGSRPQLGAHIAHALRRHRLHDDIPWQDQAVIVRSSGEVDEISRYLRRGGVPVAGGSRAFDFAAQATTRTMLMLLSVPAGEDIAEDTLRELLFCPLVGCDPLALHRMLLKVGTARLQDAPSLASVFTDLDAVRDMASDELFSTLEAAKKILSARPGSTHVTPQNALWNLWEASGRAQQWREAALEGGPDSAWYDDQLDALVALMRVADVWEQRLPDGGAQLFAQELLDRAVPVDTIARVGVRPPGVSVLTPAQAMGRHFTVVALVGLQDGSWPNMRLRTRALRADLLADLGAQRFLTGPDGRRVFNDDPYLARRAVLDDERRLLTAAVSRCTQILHIGAVSAQDFAPSAFFELLAKFSEETQGHSPLLQPAPAPLSLSGQIADLRRAAARPDEVENEDTAAFLLALLAREGIASADPDTWTGGIEASVPQNIGNGRVTLSPSHIERALECPLQWFFGRIGAQGPAGQAQQIGTIVHAIAEKYPHGTPEELQKCVEKTLSDLDIDSDSWEGIAFIETVKKKVGALSQYVEMVPDTIPVRTEQAVRAQIGDVVIVGRLDRIEEVDEGLRIADLKTGATVTKKEAEENAQLAIYQLALTQLGYKVAGARLVFLSDTPTLRLQQPLDEDERAQWTAQLHEVAKIATGVTLRAVPEERRCQMCAFHRACPARDEGRRTVD